jgi:hypothetical protein
MPSSPPVHSSVTRKRKRQSDQSDSDDTRTDPEESEADTDEELENSGMGIVDDNMHITTVKSRFTNVAIEQLLTTLWT